MPKLKVVMPDDEPDNAGEPRAEELRLLEAMLFASAEPLDEASLAERLRSVRPVARPAVERAAR